MYFTATMFDSFGSDTESESTTSTRREYDMKFSKQTKEENRNSVNNFCLLCCPGSKRPVAHRGRHTARSYCSTKQQSSSLCPFCHPSCRKNLGHVGRHSTRQKTSDKTHSSKMKKTESTGVVKALSKQKGHLALFNKTIDIENQCPICAPGSRKLKGHIGRHLLALKLKNVKRRRHTKNNLSTIHAEIDDDTTIDDEASYYYQSDKAKTKTTQMSSSAVNPGQTKNWPCKNCIGESGNQTGHAGPHILHMEYGDVFHSSNEQCSLCYKGSGRIVGHLGRHVTHRKLNTISYCDNEATSKEGKVTLNNDTSKTHHHHQCCTSNSCSDMMLHVINTTVVPLME